MLSSLPRTFRVAYRAQNSVASVSASKLALDAKKASTLSMTPAPAAGEKQQKQLMQKMQSRLKTSLVSEAFASINSMEKNSPNFEGAIAEATTVDALLSLADSMPLSPNQVRTVVSILERWISSGKAHLSEFQTDQRYIRLYRHLRQVCGAPRRTTRDLNMLLVGCDDDGVKIIANMNLRQRLNLMTFLANRNQRNLTLLRTLSYHFSGVEERLDLKLASDILYALAVLNFPDAALIYRVCNDVQLALRSNKDKPAVISSILTSLGMLKYRDPDLLEALTEWVLEHYSTCRPQDVSALVISLANLNFRPSRLQTLRRRLADSLFERDLLRAQHWLNHVWALVVLDVADADQVDSVLYEKFLARLATEGKGESRPAIKMKLLNVNGAGRLLVPCYDGAQLNPQSRIFDCPIGYEKDKVELLNGVKDALNSLVCMENYLRTNVDTTMGFLIDVECAFDEDFNPMDPCKRDHSSKRIAIIVQDYEDLCIDVDSTYNGINRLKVALLEKSGYHVLCVPHTEFSASDSLDKRVEYLEKRIQSIVNARREHPAFYRADQGHAAFVRPKTFVTFK